MKNTKSRLATTAAGVALLLVAAPAMADIANLPDPDDDAFAVTNSGVTVGDYDIDLRNVTLDHGTQGVAVTSLFSYTNADSWTSVSVKFDLNADNVADYTALWSKPSGVNGVVRNNPDGSATATCTSANPTETLGVNGTVSLSFPRTCIGSPGAFRAHVDVLWSGQNTSGEPLYFVDSAPGALGDDPVTYSAPVATSSTGTATSPVPPAPTPTPPVLPVPTPEQPALKAATWVSASLSSRTQIVGKAPVKMKVRIGSAKDNPGVLRVTSGSKHIRTLNAFTGRTYTVKMPRKLKAGLNRIKVTFTPNYSHLYEGSSRTVKLRVRR